MSKDTTLEKRLTSHVPFQLEDYSLSDVESVQHFGFCIDNSQFKKKELEHDIEIGDDDGF